MLQRTRADQVEKVYNHFTSAYYTISQASKQDEETLLELFKPLGLNWRNKKLVELIHYLSEHELPTTKEELIKLPGVGNYSANAFISFHLGKKAPITDSNAVRLWSRIFGFDTDSEMHKKKTFNNFVEKITPETEYKDFNYAVLDLTRDICKRNPQCTICPLNQICIYYQEKTKS